MPKERGDKVLVQNFKRARVLIKNIKYGENIEGSMHELTALLNDNHLLITMTTEHRKNLLVKALEKSQHMPEFLVNVYHSGLLKLLLAHGVNPAAQDQGGADALITLRKNKCWSQTVYVSHPYASPDPSDPAVRYNRYLEATYFPTYNQVTTLLKDSIKEVSADISALDRVLIMRMLMSTTPLSQDIIGITASYLSIAAVGRAGLSCGQVLSERYFAVKERGLFSPSRKSIGHLIELAAAEDCQAVNAELDKIEQSSCQTLKTVMTA